MKKSRKKFSILAHASVSDRNHPHLELTSRSTLYLVPIRRPDLGVHIRYEILRAHASVSDYWVSIWGHINQNRCQNFLEGTIRRFPSKVRRGKEMFFFWLEQRIRSLRGQMNFSLPQFDQDGAMSDLIGPRPRWAGAFVDPSWCLRLAAGSVFTPCSRFVPTSKPLWLGQSQWGFHQSFILIYSYDTSANLLSWHDIYKEREQQSFMMKLIWYSYQRNETRRNARFVSFSRGIADLVCGPPAPAEMHGRIDVGRRAIGAVGRAWVGARRLKSPQSRREVGRNRRAAGLRRRTAGWSRRAEGQHSKRRSSACNVYAEDSTSSPSSRTPPAAQRTQGSQYAVTW